MGPRLCMAALGCSVVLAVSSGLLAEEQNKTAVVTYNITGMT